jgi:undecaprenyl-diphosphatase
MDLLQAFILGVVEGVTEFLPISSTGHLILASHLLGLPQSDFVKTFEIAIQLGAIGAVLALYWRQFLDIEILKRLAVGFMPTAVIGLLLYPFIKAHLVGNQQVVLWALALGGAVLILFELFHTESPAKEGEVEQVGYLQALGVGLFQALAVIPGVSRSAATIVGGLLLGLRRHTIVEFSFLLAVPTMAAATGLDVLKNYQSFTTAHIAPLAVGYVTAFVVALLSITWLLRMIKHHTFIPFGVYRILVALLFWFLVL